MNAAPTNPNDVYCHSEEKLRFYISSSIAGRRHK